MNLVAALNAKRHFLSRDLDSTLAELPHNRSVEASSSLLAARRAMRTLPDGRGCDPAGTRGKLSVPGTQALTLRVLYRGTPSGVPDGSLVEVGFSP